MEKNTKKIVITAVVAMMVLGLVSAALLTYYGKITGTAEVTQSVTLNGMAWNSPSDFKFGSFNEPASFINLSTLKNDAKVPITIGFETTCKNTAGYDDGIQINNNINWSAFGNDHCDGITTRYVEYFDDAGANFSNYETPTTCNITVGSGQTTTIQVAIDDASTVAGDVICVKTGTYAENVVVNKNITLVSSDGQGSAIIAPTSGDAITLTGKTVTIQGFAIKGAVFGIKTIGSTVTIRDNAITGYTKGGINVNGGTVNILNNVIEPTTIPSTSYSVDSIYTLGGAVVTITNNDLGNNQYGPNAYNGYSQWSTSAGIAVHNGDVVTATLNNIYNNDFGIQLKYEGTTTTVTANHNNIYNNTMSDCFFEKLSTDTSATFDATNNWWGTDGINTSAGNSTGFIDVDSYINATWMTKTDMTLAPNGAEDKFGIINNFALLIPNNYTITTKVVPK